MYKEYTIEKYFNKKIKLDGYEVQDVYHEKIYKGKSLIKALIVYIKQAVKEKDYILLSLSSVIVKEGGIIKKNKVFIV